MNGDAVRKKLIRVSQKHLGDWGEQFILHQCERLGMDINNMSRDDVMRLSTEASKTAVIVVGKGRAEGLRRDIERIAKDMV